MRAYFRLLAIQLKISAAAAMAYRANFLIEGVFGVGWAFLTLLPLFVIYGGGARGAGGAAPTYNGWDYSAALVVMAYFQALHALLEGLIGPSLQDLVERIRNGSFDYVLLKPVDAQAIVSASRCEPWKIFDFLIAIAIAVYAFSLRGTAPSAGDIALGVALFVAGALGVYSLWIACASLAFWVGRLDNLIFLLGSIFDTARWPVAVFPGAWRVVFTFVIPIAVMTTFPAMALLGSLGWQQLVGTLAGAAILMVASRLVWRAAIANYTSASS